MATVRHVCGECGAGVARADVRCKACGSTLDWSDSRPSGVTRPKSKGSAETGRRGIEPWQIISFVAVGAVLVFLVWSEVTRDRVAPVVSTPPPVMQMPIPDAAPRVDLGQLEAAVAADPKDGEARLRLANGLHDSGMLPRAIEQYQAYLKLHPDNPDARVDLGICYDQLGLRDSVQAEKYFALAIGEMEAVVKARPLHQPAAFNLGIVALHRGDLDGSNRWLKKTAEIDRNSELGMRAQRMLQQHSFTP